MILPKSLREKQDRESYVSRLIDLTRTLCHEPKPTAENFTSITHSVCIVLDEWASGGRDTRPYKEEVEWVYPYYKFTQSMRHLPPDTDGICKVREYAIDGAEKKEIDAAMWDLYRDLEKIAFQFELRLTDARDPRVPLKRYGRGADLDQPWWWRPMVDSEVVDGEGLMTKVRLRTGVVGFFTEDLDDILHSFELLAADNAPPESDIRHEYDKLIQELDMSKNGNVPKNGRYGGRSVFDGKKVHPDITSDSKHENITVNGRSFKLTRAIDWTIADRMLSAVESESYATKEGIYDIDLTSDEYNGLSKGGKDFVAYSLDREKLKKQKQGLKYTGKARIRLDLLRPNV